MHSLNSKTKEIKTRFFDIKSTNDNNNKNGIKK